MSELKDRLKQILVERSVLRGNFKLSSGEESSYYVDARLTTLDAEGVNIISKIFLDEISKDPSVNAAGGPTLGADPVVGALISQSWDSSNPLKGFIVRKKSKKHGTSKMIEGNLDRGDNVVMVEDVITSGGSVLNAINAVEEVGGKVKKVFCIVDREQGAEAKFRDAGYEFFPIFRISELL